MLPAWRLAHKTAVPRNQLLCKASPAAYAQAEDQGDTITFMFESENQERISDFELKLMDIDSEQLGIPDTEYTATVRMPSSEFQRICKCAGASTSDTVAWQMFIYQDRFLKL